MINKGLPIVMHHSEANLVWNPRVVILIKDKRAILHSPFSKIV